MIRSKCSGSTSFRLKCVKDKVIEAVWTFADPKHWRGADESPELLTAMQPADLKLLTGCSLEWKKVEDHFAAEQRPEAVPLDADLGAGGRLGPLAHRTDGRSAGASANRPTTVMAIWCTARPRIPFIRLRKRSNTQQ